MGRVRKDKERLEMIQAVKELEEELQAKILAEQKAAGILNFGRQRDPHKGLRKIIQRKYIPTSDVNQMLLRASSNATTGGGRRL
jgi:hypothetical protein